MCLLLFISVLLPNLYSSSGLPEMAVSNNGRTDGARGLEPHCLRKTTALNMTWQSLQAKIACDVCQATSSSPLSISAKSFSLDQMKQNRLKAQVRQAAELFFFLPL